MSPLFFFSFLEFQEGYFTLSHPAQQDNRTAVSLRRLLERADYVSALLGGSRVSNWDHG